MDKAIIFGIYNFLSFHTSKALLNKGIEVIGIHVDGMEQDCFLEEKRLEVGRNANFSELTLTEWENTREQDVHKGTLVLSIYDLYMLNKESILKNEKVTKQFYPIIENSLNKLDIVLILPMQMLTSKQDETIAAILERVNGWGNNIQLFYLPAIYGPWQPDSFIFQQAILSKMLKIELINNEREWKNDVLYIQDAVETILERLETTKNGKTQSYMLESGKKNYWNECASYLKIDEKITITRSEPVQIDSQIVRIPIKKVTPIADSFKKQIDQVDHLYSNHS